MAKTPCFALALCAVLALASAANLQPAPAKPRSLRIPIPAASSGAMMSLSQSSLNYINKVITPVLTSVIQGLHLPEIKIDKDGWSVHLFDIHTVTYNPGTTKLQLVSGQGLELELHDFYLHIHVHFDAKEDSWPHISTSGTAECTTHHAKVGATIQVGESGGKPTVSAHHVTANTGNFDIKFSDGILGALLNLLENLFQHQVDDAVNNALQGAITTIIDNLNNSLKNTNLHVPLGNGAVASFDLTSTPQVTSQYLGVNAVGAVEKPGVRPPPSGVGPSVPPFSASDADHYLQLGISTYFFETLVWVYEQEGALSTVIHHSAIPSDLVFQLNTTDLSAFAPGLKTAFPNMWCQLQIAVNGSATITTSSGGGGFTAVAPLQLDVQPVTPHGPVTAFQLLCNVTASAKLHVAQSGSKTAIAGNLTYISCPLTAGHSVVGPVQASGLSDIINFALSDIALPMVNKVFNAGIPLPSLGPIKLTNTELGFEDNAVVVASDFSVSEQAVKSFADECVRASGNAEQRD